jgi:hypothetical protein
VTSWTSSSSWRPTMMGFMCGWAARWPRSPSRPTTPCSSPTTR